MPGSPTSRSAALGPSLAGLSTAYPSNQSTSTLSAPSPSMLPSPTSAQAASFGGFDLAGGGAGAFEMGLTESSPSGSLLSFDWTYAEDLLGSVGMSVHDSGGVLPLWLSDSDLGSSQLLSGGMEDFFLPSDIDLQLDLYSANGSSSQTGQGDTPGAASDPGLAIGTHAGVDGLASLNGDQGGPGWGAEWNS